MPEAQTAPESPYPGPKKEITRITMLAGPPKPSGSVQMKKTQPLISIPEARTTVAPVNVAPKETRPRVDAIPISLGCTILGASAAILIIQIWNYLS